MRIGSKVRVLHVMEERQFGGAFSVVTTLIRGMDPDRFEITLCMLGNNTRSLETASVPCEVILCRMNGLWDLLSVVRMKKIIQDHGIDIVHTHLPRADVVGRFAARLAKVPAVFTTIHAIDQHRENRSRMLHALADRITLRFATKVICVSEAVRQHLCQWYRRVADQVITIHNGIDLRRFDVSIDSAEAKRAFGLSLGTPVVGLTARLRPVKGVKYLLMAVQQLIAQKISVQCLIVGDGVSRMDLEATAAKLGIQEQVVFTGYREDVSEALAAMDVLVQSSVSEGLPTCLLEAMAMRKPIVATAVGGVPEVVTHGESGVLVPARDPERLAAEIADLLAVPERRQKMGEKGRAVALRRFDCRNMIQAYESLYVESMLGRGSAVDSMESGAPLPLRQGANFRGTQGRC